jgi:hypothetical protein
VENIPYDPFMTALFVAGLWAVAVMLNAPDWLLLALVCLFLIVGPGVVLGTILFDLYRILKTLLSK